MKGTTNVQDLYNKNKRRDKYEYKDESNKANTLKQNAA